MKHTGAEILAKCLVKEGVDFIFGYPGGAALHIYDALYQHESLKHILVRHEQGATHAADGYSRSTGRTGVVLVTSGPGMTNTVTGIATAYMDSIPMVVITAQVPSTMIGSDAFQEMDSVGVTRPCVKHNFLIMDVKDIASTIKKAFYIASSGRPGPVVVDIPKDISGQKCNFDYPKEIDIRSYQPTLRGHPNQIKKALDLLLKSKRPIIYTGGGVVISNAEKEVTELVDILQMPSTSTLMGLGSIASSNSNFLGMLGMHGTYEANMAMHECDVMLAIGARFDDRVTGELSKFSPNSKKIQIDIDPSSIGKNVDVHIPIVGDCKVIVTQMLNMLKKKTANKSDGHNTDWWRTINSWKKLDSLNYSLSEDAIKPQEVLRIAHQLTKGEAYVTSDVGQHQMWAAQHYLFEKPRKWINSGGLGTMGFGLPAAMGVQLAFPSSTVLCVTGDASIQMCIQELSTCSQYNLPIKIINLNNQYMGMVRQWQEFFYDRRYSSSYMDSLPDFVKLVESYGHVGMRIKKPSDVKSKLEEAFEMKDKLVFIDIWTDIKENVYPMIEGGKGHHEMVLNPDMDKAKKKAA